MKARIIFLIFHIMYGIIAVMLLVISMWYAHRPGSTAGGFVAILIAAALSAWAYDLFGRLHKRIK